MAGGREPGGVTTVFGTIEGSRLGLVSGRAQTWGMGKPDQWGNWCHMGGVGRGAVGGEGAGVGQVGGQESRAGQYQWGQVGGFWEGVDPKVWQVSQVS